MIGHPERAQIALFSGGDLGRWQRWSVARHIARCSPCRREVEALRGAAIQLRELAAEMPDLPNGLSWSRLAGEMTGNIRVGLAAGEAIALFDKPLRTKSWLGRPHISRPDLSQPDLSRPHLSVNAALVVLGACAIFGIAFWTSLPPQQAGHLLSSLERIRTERIGTFLHPDGIIHPVKTTTPGSVALAGAPAEDVVLEASSASIQVRENGRAMSLMAHSDGATVSVSVHGSAGVRFVDADTGQVTTNKVYYAEQ
jgi:hypothetical protein